ncbi:MAG: flagellar basal body-associated FliL family protein [SAR324 cluster bacterium]|nr:flagellar basal body-associated FliL family protein [SAR324 cluster bacterium]
MAEEESDGGQQSAVPGTPPPPVAGGSKSTPIIIAVGVLLLIVAGVVGYFLFFSNEKQNVEANSPEEAKLIEQYNLRSQPSVDAIKGSGEPLFTPVFSYTLNMKDGQHMMKLSWRAMLFDKKALDYLMNLKPAIENDVGNLLREWKAEDLRNRSGLELLKQRIHQELNSFFDQQFIELPDSKDRTPVKEILIVEYYIN